MPINDNQQTINQRYIEIDGEQIPVTEEVYRAYKQPAYWNINVKNVRNPVL